MKTIILISSLLTSSVGYAVNMDIIAYIESSNKTQAYNRQSGARGLYQITRICLEDYNNLHTIKYNKNDLFDPEINKKIAYWYMNVRIPQLLKYYNIDDNINNRLIAYNAGIKRLIDNELPKETKNYLKKYHRLLDKR